MGPALETTLSAPAKAGRVDNLTTAEINFEKTDDLFEFSDPEIGEEVTTYPDEIRWPAKTIEAFKRHFSELPNDATFDSFDNRLVKTIRSVSTDHELFCIKCLGMRALKKHGKVNNSYQFECRNHKISAKQILENLPDELISEIIPNEPRAYFNSVLKWLSKDHLSPELVKLTTERNAVKRFSQTQEDETNVCSSLIKSRAVENGIISESIGLKTRIATLEETVNRLVKQIESLAEVNSSLKSENKALIEENNLLKRHLAAPQTAIIKQKNQSSYARISSINRPMNATMKFYTKAGNLTPKATTEPVLKQEVKKAENGTIADSYSPLKLVFFEGCHRKTASTYRNMLPKIGIEAHWARDISFLAEDLVQITTFESKADLLIKAMESISPSVKHLPDFDPCAGVSYKKYGKLTDESAKKAYFTLMEKNAERLKKDSKVVPSLKRVAAFFAKVVEAKDTKYQAPSRAPTVFFLGDFLKIETNEAADSAMEIVEINGPSQEISEGSQMNVEGSTTQPANEN